MRSVILIFLAILAFASTPAHAQSASLKRSMVEVICSRQADPAEMTARLAKRLNLTDPQKSALREMADAFASADASAKQSLCADKPDLFYDAGPHGIRAKDGGDQGCGPEGNRAQAPGVL